MASMASPLHTGLNGAGSIRPSLRRNGPPAKVAMPIEELKQLSQLLEAAIQTGEVEKAKELVEQLAMEKVKVNLDVDAETFENRLKEQSFSLKVIIEDRVSTGNCIFLTVKASDTIFDLKKKMMLDFNFPMEVQKWIISRRVAEDFKTLQSYQVKGQGCTAYLYLIMAKSVHLDKETYENNRTNGDYVTMSSPLYQPPSLQANVPPSMPVEPQLVLRRRADDVPVLRTSGSIPQVPLQLLSEPSVEPDIVYRGSGKTSRLLEAPAPSASQQQPVGWQCVACTFVNRPTRPGCELCGNERPVGYKIPEGYVLSDEETRWIAETMETERLVHEDESQRGRSEHRGDESPLSEEQLDLILRFNDAIIDMASKDTNTRPTLSAQPVNRDVPDSLLYASSEEDNSVLH